MWYAIEPDTSRCYYCGEEIELAGRDYVTRDGISDSAQPRHHFHHWQRRPYPWQRLTEREVAL
jgi:hypothetical protein